MRSLTPVVTTYSWEKRPRVVLRNTLDEAEQYLKADFENERRIDIEENGFIPGENYEAKQEDADYAYIKIFRANGDIDITEWSIGEDTDVPEPPESAESEA